MKLKPCPFCGARMIDGMISHSNECFIQKLIYKHPAREIEDAWQVRATDPLLKEVAEALGDLVFECDGIFDTRKPSRETYNKAFYVLQKYHEQKV